MSKENAARAASRSAPGVWTRRLPIVGTFVLAVSLAMLVPFIFTGVLKSSTTYVNMFAVVAAAAFAMGALGYLQPRRSRASSIVREEEVVRLIAKSLSEHAARMAESTITLTPDEREAAVKSIVNEFQTDLVAGQIQKLEASMQDVLRQNSYRDPIEQARFRLMRQSDALVRRGNLNLVIGMIMAAAGVFILGQSILAPTSFSSWDGMLSAYAPRFSLVLLIEVFAYFFLRLYKQSLDDGKYYQNELTNIELKLSAANASFELKDDALRSKVIESLVSTERNFILEKGQSTIDLERSKLQQEGVSASLKELGALLRGIIPTRSAG
ncbi:hypothetical protein ABU614_07010 [Lysobacter firmicutimachus]|uniref:Uncharacterized protein n=1 Tax=Lysobacter firmicutimachus TaxID=1792846 RepID=A0AAU8MZ62_9GAMM